MAANLTVTVQCATRMRGLPSQKKFQRWVGTALRSVGYRRAAEVTIRLVNAAEGRKLNRVWRQKDYATNVLAFPAGLPPGVRSPLLGDLVICAPVVRREAADQGKRLEAHWAHLTVHGTLHLLGYDHEASRQAQEMESLETAILACLGYPDPYTV
ncbi:MAG: rRNA maturation RNase YbeY [Gemmataceae bacterium]